MITAEDILSMLEEEDGGMTVTVVVENRDGGYEEMAMSKEVMDIHDLLYLYQMAAVAMGFTYVDRVGYATDKGAETWSAC